VTLDIIAKANGDPITSGTVNFYLLAITGTNAGKWFRGSDNSWQSSEAIADAASYKAGSLWQLSIVSAAWISGVIYNLYAKESGNLNIIYSDVITTDLFNRGGITKGGSWTFAKLQKILAAWSMGKWQTKTGFPGTYQIIDPDDGQTVIAEITPNITSPQKVVEIKI